MYFIRHIDLNTSAVQFPLMTIYNIEGSFVNAKCKRQRPSSLSHCHRCSPPPPPQISYYYNGVRGGPLLLN